MALMLAACLLAVSCPCRAMAAESVELALGRVQGEGWRVDDPRAVLDLSDEKPVLRLTVPAVLGSGDRVLAEAVTLTCRGIDFNSAYAVCPDGRVSVRVPPGKRPLETSVSFVLRRADGHWRAEGRAGLGDGLAWSAVSDASGLSATFAAGTLSVAELDPWLPRLPGGVTSLSGTFSDLEAKLSLPAEGPPRLEGTVTGEEMGFDTAAGTVAAAGVAGRVDFDWQARADGWRGQADVRVQGGEVLAGSFYTSLSEEPLAVSATLAASEDIWRVEALDVEHAGALSLSATATWDWGPEQGLRELDARLAELRFPAFYTHYLQPVLAQYGFGELRTAGGMGGRVTMEDGQVDSLELVLNHLDVSDSRERLDLTGLNGDVRWRREGELRPSHVTWQGGRIYRIDIGSADIRAEAAGGDFRLTRETLLPVLDGALVINALRVDDWFGERPELLFDARLMPISLGTLSGALGWPELQGTLAGRLPELTLKDGVYRLGGSLMVDVFDGTVLVENLRMERPFGVLPKLVADIQLNDLDLESLTGTFTIGRITGRVDGYLRNLRLLDWQAVHFDARLATPADDESSHRISQRAVDTLSNLGGGGAGGALSRTFLRVFDDFAYRRLGIACELRNNVCEMNGVAPAPDGGYYIVEGGGLPRVHVIGYVRRVDWPVLIDQLMRSMQGQPPTVGGGS